MKVIKTKITEVKLNPSNPRTIKDDKFKKLVKSITDFPEMLEIRPIVVNDDMVVLGGNMRLKACQEAGLKEIPVIKIDDLTPEQQREFIIKDNIGYGEWDWELLTQDWTEDELDEWGLDVVRHDWEQLDYIEEEQPLPETNKDNVIQVVLPEAFISIKREVEDALKTFLSEKYSGCEIK